MLRGWKAASTVPRRVARRFGWGLADQMMSSLSNAALSFYVARVLGAAEFGAFSLAYVTYSFALNASRGLATDPLLVRFSGAELPAWRRAVSQCTGTAVVVGMVTGTCALAAAAVLSGTARLAFLALGLTLPGLLLQDSWRYAFFALGRGSQAFINDTVWTLALIPPMLYLRFTHRSTVFVFVLAWGLAATVAACAGPIQARLMPKPASAWEWVSRHRDLGPRYLAENTANSGSSQLRIYGVGLIAGLAAVGYVQAAGLLMGPFLVVFMGISLVTVPEAARILRQSPHRLRRYCLLVGGGLAVLGLLWGILLLIALPRGLGDLLLGKELWPPTYGLVLPFTISIMGGCVSNGAAAGLRALGAARRSLRAMIIASVVFLGCGLAGAYFGGALGTVRGAAIATWIGAVVWWWQLRLAIRESGKVPPRTRLSSLHLPGHREPAQVPVPAGGAVPVAEADTVPELDRPTASVGFGARTEDPAIADTRSDLWTAGYAWDVTAAGSVPYVERATNGDLGAGHPDDTTSRDAGEQQAGSGRVAPAPVTSSTDRGAGLPGG